MGKLWSGTLGCALVVLTSTLAQAQATRTWVSGVGDDSTFCTRTAPCKTFAGALSRTAAKGEINVLDAGGYGIVTITKPVSIIAEGVLGGVLVSPPNAMTNAINIDIPGATASDVVVLRGLDINGLGGFKGINIVSAGAVFVENCLIYGFTSNAIQGDPPTANSRLFVKNTRTYNVRSGLVVGQTVNATVENFHSEHNLYGIQVNNNGEAHITGSVLSSNTYHGVVAIGNAHATVENTTIGYNGDTGAIASGGGAVVRITGNTITGNTTGIAGVSGGQLISFGDNDIDGNDTDGTATSTVPRI